MKQKDILAGIINDVDAAISGSSITTNGSTRTTGGDTTIDPPELVIEGRATRLPNYAGASNFAGFTRDSNSNATGREFHQYYRYDVEVVSRAEKEEAAYDILALIQDTFSPYEFDGDKFDADTTEWYVGSITPRGNPVIEPDYYELRTSLSFVYVRKTTTTDDTLETINSTVEIDLTLEDGETTIN